MEVKGSAVPSPQAKKREQRKGILLGVEVGGRGDFSFWCVRKSGMNLTLKLAYKHTRLGEWGSWSCAAIHAGPFGTGVEH